MNKKTIIHILYIILNFLLFMMPYYLTKKGNHSRNTGAIIILVLSVLWVILNKKFEIDKKIIITILGFLSFMTISLLLREDHPKYMLKIYFDLVVAVFLFIGITQLDISEKFFKYFPLLMSIFLIFPIVRAFFEWGDQDFSATYRIIGDNWPSVFSVEMGLLILVPMIAFFYEKKLIIQIFYILVSSMGYFVIVITQTRAIIVIIPFIFLILTIYKKKKIILMILISVFLLLLFFLGGGTKSYFQRFNQENNDGRYSTMIRMKIYERSLQLGKESKFMGIGFENYHNYSIKHEPYFPEYVDYNNFELKIPAYQIPVNDETVKIWGYILTEHLHNNFLEVLITQGILSFIFYVSSIFYIFKNLIISLKKKRGISEQCIVLGILGLFFICIHGILETNLYMIKANQILYIFLGLALNKKSEKLRKNN